MTDNSKRIQSIQQVSGTIMKLSRFSAIIGTIITVLMVLAGIVLFAFSGILNPMIQADIEAGSFDFDVKSFGPMVWNMASTGRVTQALGLWCLFMGFYLLLLTFIFILLHRIFKGLCLSYSPFIPDNIRNMKIMFLLIALLTLRSSLLIGLIIGFVLWSLLLIYEYGCCLQNESDETL